MNEDERRLLNEIMESRRELNDRIKKLMTCVLAVFCVMLMISSITISITVVTSNKTIREIESHHTDVVKSIQSDNSTTIQELWRYYFETDYIVPDMTQSQDIRIGDD